MPTAQQKDVEDVAVRMLAIREHTEKQLTLKLLNKHFQADDVERVIEDLKQRNLLSDNRFASQYVFSRINRGYGPLRIEKEMREKGVNEKKIAANLEEYRENWPDIMLQALKKKFGSSKTLNFSERARQARFLEYRGFPSALIRQQLFRD